MNEKLSKAEIIFLISTVLLVSVLHGFRLSYPTYLVFDERHRIFTTWTLLDGTFPRSPESIDYYPGAFFGDYINAFGMLLFGNNPFGWRVMAALAGSLSVFCFYFLAKEVSRSKRVAFMAASIFCFSFLYAVHSRNAMFDIFFGIFIINSFYFSLRAIDGDGGQVDRSMYRLAALFLGLTLATKITGFFVVLIILLYVKLTKRDDPLQLRYFVVIPLLIYFLSYMQIFMAGDGLVDWVKLQTGYIKFHYMVSGASQPHPYQSNPLTWFSMSKPHWYWVNQNEGGTMEAIVIFGNPILWWSFVPSLFYVICRFIKKRGEMDLFMLLWFFLLCLPWFSRGMTWVYYMIPCIPVMCIVVAEGLDTLLEKNEIKFFFNINTKLIVALFFILLIAVYLIFYPFLTGIPVSRGYYDLIDEGFLREGPRGIIKYLMPSYR